MTLRERISILPPAFDCPDCGVECEAVTTFDPSMGEYVSAWWCPSCEAKFYREIDGEVKFYGVAEDLGRGGLLARARRVFRGKN